MIHNNKCSFESADSYALYMSNRRKTVLFCSSYMYNYFERCWFTLHSTYLAQIAIIMRQNVAQNNYIYIIKCGQIGSLKAENQVN